MYNNCIVFHHQLFGRCAHLDGSAMHINTVEVVSKVSFGVDLLSDCNWVFIHVKLTRTSKTFGSIESKVCEYNLKPLAHSLRHSHFGMLASIRSVIGISIIHWDAYIIPPLPLPLTLSFAWHFNCYTHFSTQFYLNTRIMVVRLLRVAATLLLIDRYWSEIKCLKRKRSTLFWHFGKLIG